MPRRITSPQNQRIKDAVRLRQHRARQKQGRMIIDGVRELAHAVRADLEWIDVFVCPEFCHSDQARHVLEQLADRKVEVSEVAPPVMEKLAFGHRREGVVGVARTPSTQLARLPLPPNPFLVALEAVEKPGNVGAVIRTADAAGADAVVICDGGTDLFNPNTIRASLGAIFCQPVAAAPTSEVVSWIMRRAERVFVARVDGRTDYASADYSGSIAIVLGSEAAGLSDAWQGDQVMGIRLPMHGVADSLNVASAAAVLLYEAQRQRCDSRR